jgi:hypothetical protein
MSLSIEERTPKKPMTEGERLTYLERLIDATEDVEGKFGVNPLSASRRGGKIADA